MSDPHDAGNRTDLGLTPVDFDPFADAPAGAAIPLTEAQREIWAVVWMGPEASCAYNLCFAMRLVGGVAVEILRRAVQEVFERHEALRMTFDASGEWQRPRPGTVEVPLIDLSGLPTAQREARVEAILAAEGDTPFDLVAGPPARAQVVIEAADRHLLVLTGHHIVLDGWSAWVFFREVAALYGAGQGGPAADLPTPEPFSAYARRDTGEEGRGRLAAALAYWRARFGDGAPTLDLPTDRPRPAMKTYRGRRETLRLDPAVSAGIKRTAGRQNATSVGFLLSAFQALLCRLTGQPDVVVGLPVSVRPPADARAIVGHATNLLPIRATIDGAAPFATHLKAVTAALLDAQDHQALTFGTLVHELNLPRDPSRTPLVAAMFNLDRGRFRPPAFPNARAEMHVPPRSHLNFEIELNVVELGSEFLLECTYNADLFDAATVRRWLGHYQTLLAAAAADPQTLVGALPLLTDAERAALEGWNATGAEVPDASLPELVSAQAERTPARIAVEFEGGTLTYRDLEERSGRLAARLRARGVGPGARVGVFMERSPQMLVGLMGVLKAGAAYVPLDPAFPAERLAYMVEDSGAALLLTHAAVESELPTRAVPVIRVEDQEELPPGADLRGSQPAPTDLAYVIYTSGSTGKPKGVAITHRSLVNLLLSMGREPGLSEDDVLLSVTTLSFDIAALELYLPLLKGARIALASREETTDGRRLVERLATSGATVMQATPATWRLLLESGWKGKAGLKVLCGGEALPRDLADELLGRAAEVWNVYGPTETTVWSSAWRVEAGDGPVSIGRPIANTGMYVLDGRLAPLPVGVAGELYIGGMGVARGYWGRPELTAERFVPDPFSREPGARMYRTGDLARWRPDGTLECLGRIDHQVKVRGFRIELGEIEAALRQHPGAQAAVVVAEDTAAGDRRLVAYMTHGAAAAPTATELRSFLRKTLPDYMVPSLFVSLDALPLTPNGKVDRKRLQATLSAPLRGEARVAPRTPMERLVADVWREALGVDSVSVRDNFFDLGGHSLMAARVLTRLEGPAGRRISPREIVFQTLEQFAAGLEASGSPGAGEPPPTPPPLARRLLDAMKRRFRGEPAPSR